MNDMIANQLQIAERLLEQGKREEAFSVLVKILRQNAENPEAWYLLGFTLDEPDKKKYAFEKTLQFAPQHRDAREQLFLISKKSVFNEANSLNPKISQHPRKIEGKVTEAHNTARPSQTDITTTSYIRINAFFRFPKYVLKRAFTIGLTIIIGVFFTVLLANKDGQLDMSIQEKLENQIRRDIGLVNSDLKRLQFAQAVEEINERSGLNLPYLPRHLRWTLNALTFDWGEVMFSSFSITTSRQGELTNAREIILNRLPNSLLLIGAANLIIFSVGIPLSLKLSRRKSDWQDKFFSFLSPISSIPSWIHGVILILIFAIETQLLPPGGMFDLTPPEGRWDYILMIGKHMILPVLAIILGLIFQLTYTWRTFFLIYSNEDYVDLAKAKGLRDKVIEKKYILRPSMPFVITSFSLTLVGFWQMTIALEHVFNWPGIGQLYIGSLPNFWQEAMFPGEMTITVSLVVLFAYLLGLIVFILDMFYALVDPRVNVVDQGIRVSVGILVQLLDFLYAQVDPRMRLRYRSMRANEKSIPIKIRELLKKWNPFQNPATFPLSSQSVNYPHLFEALQKRLIGIGQFLLELRRYPSAIIGLVIIFMMVLGSLYALIALPYSEIGASWYSESVTGEITTPKLAQPEWMNLFRKDDLLATLLINEDNHPGIKTTEVLGEDLESVFINFEFDFPYAAMPEEIYLNITPKYKDKRPFVVLTWFTPDGREIPLKGFSAESENQYSLIEYIPRQIRIDPKIVAQRPSDRYGNYFLQPLFGIKDSTSDQPVSGTYRLQVEGMLFEEDSDLDAEFLALGQVYGLVGTDIMRRDLLIPLVWGMPFALFFGLGGATVTTILAMIIAATGTWFGGWVDGSIQRLNEAVMILPILALAVLLYAFFDISIWTVLIIMVILNIFGSPAKAFRAAFIQVRESPYVEAAQAYGASNSRIIMRYMIPRIIPVLIPQLIVLIPSFVFLEATLGLFNINLEYPTWGQVIYEALKHGVAWGSRYWVLEPIALLLLTGFSFAMLGFALDQILNPKLKSV